jgi:chemotaxis methyl-accepting protein methylase
MVLMQGWRHPNGGTYLLRNKPELELIREIAASLPEGTPFRVAVLGCSIGMEVYSVRWQLRALVPYLDVRLVGLDVDQASIEKARVGAYPLPEHEWMLTRLSDAEREEIIEIDGGVAHIRPYLRHGIEWLVGDAGDARLHEHLGQFDLVLANRFLCHMAPEPARACLRNILKLVAPGGHLFVSGVDLGVRQSMLRESGFVPRADRLPAIHDGDPSLLEGWPLQSWGLEPLDKTRHDWIARYAMVYQRPE